MPGENSGSPTQGTFSSPDDIAKALAALRGGGGGANTGPSASNALGGNFTAGGKQPMVFWGATARNTNTRDSSRDEVLAASGFTRRGIRELPLQEAVADFYNWPDSERQAWGQRLYKLGVLKDPNDYQGMMSAWQDAVQQASNFYTVAGKRVTPWQVVDLMAGGGAQAHPTTNTSTATSVNVPTVEDAHAAAKTVTQALLGRDPDKNEMDRLASIMTGYAQKNPSVTKTTQTNDGKGNVTSSSTSSGGYSAAGMGDLLQENVKADPEYGAYQAATTYFGALMNAIGVSDHG